MINDIIEAFHQKRNAGEHVDAIKQIEKLKTRYSFSDKDLVTAMVTEDFKSEECWEYLEKYRKEGI